MSNRVRLVLDVLVEEQSDVQEVGQSLKKAADAITGFVVDAILVEGGHYKVEKEESGVFVHQHNVGNGSPCDWCRAMSRYRSYEDLTGITES